MKATSHLASRRLNLWLCGPVVGVFGLISSIGVGAQSTAPPGDVTFTKHYIDIRRAGDETPSWIVHHVYGVHTDFKLFPFGNPDPLHKVHIEICMRRTFDPGSAKCTDGSRTGICKDDVSVSID